MSDTSSPWSRRARAGLNRLLDRIAEFEAQGGVQGALQRGLDRVKQEQQRMRNDAQMHGPFAHIARIRQAYARLEIPFGSDVDTVRSAYRQLMRRYHPDRHADDPEREQVATEIAQKLTVAYDLLVKHLER